MKSTKKLENHRQKKAQAILLIKVQGVGFEPTNLYRIGS
jgi:hypothetical protein